MSTLWIALTADEKLVSLGQHESFCQAENASPGNTVWLLDDESASKWKEQLQEILSTSAKSENSWLCVDHDGEIRYVGEFGTGYDADASIGFDTVWVLHRDTGISWIEQFRSFLNQPAQACA